MESAIIETLLVSSAVNSVVGERYVKYILTIEAYMYTWTHTPTKLFHTQIYEGLCKSYRVSFSGSPVAWGYQKMSRATWLKQLVAQLGYQPCTMEVKVNANEMFDIIPKY